MIKRDEVRVVPPELNLMCYTKSMLWTIIIVLFILWLLGFGFKIGGGLIHILLVIALIVIIYRLLF